MVSGRYLSASTMLNETENNFMVCEFVCTIKND